MICVFSNHWFYLVLEGRTCKYCKTDASAFSSLCFSVKYKNTSVDFFKHDVLQRE